MELPNSPLTKDLQKLRKFSEGRYNSEFLPEDRFRVQAAIGRVVLYVFGSGGLGASLGVFLAYSIRRNRNAIFRALRARRRPTHVGLADGKVGTFNIFLLAQYVLGREHIRLTDASSAL